MTLLAIMQMHYISYKLNIWLDGNVPLVLIKFSSVLVAVIARFHVLYANKKFSRIRSLEVMGLVIGS